MAELAEKNPKIKTAYAVLRQLSEDEQVRRLAEAAKESGLPVDEVQQLSEMIS